MLMPGIKLVREWMGRQGKDWKPNWVHYRQVIIVNNWNSIQLRTSGEECRTYLTENHVM